MGSCINILHCHGNHLYLVGAYHQIPVGIPKTAITTPLGLFEYIRMPFGLHKAQTFQRFIDQVLRDQHFADDILITSSTPEEH